MANRSKKRAPGSRPAVDRGIPVKVVDALIEIGGCDEEGMTEDSVLASDLSLNDEDLVEIGDLLGIEDECLDWLTVRDIVSSCRKDPQL